jgi:hypothetical protein
MNVKTYELVELGTHCGLFVRKWRIVFGDETASPTLPFNAFIICTDKNKTKIKKKNTFLRQTATPLL